LSYAAEKEVKRKTREDKENEVCSDNNEVKELKLQQKAKRYVDHGSHCLARHRTASSTYMSDETCEGAQLQGYM